MVLRMRLPCLGKRVLAASLVLVTSACGGRAPPGAGAAGAPPSSDAGPLPEAGLDAGLSDGASPTGDTDVLAVVLRAGGVRFITHDGAILRTVLAGDADFADMAQGLLSSRAGYILLQVIPNTSSWHGLNMLLDAGGGVLWRDQDAYGTPTMGDDGTLAEAFGAPASPQPNTHVIRADGTAVDLSGFSYIGGATADAFLPMATSRLSDVYAAADFGWWKIGSAAPAPLGASPLAPSDDYWPSMLAFGRTFAYFAEESGHVSFVAETPDGRTSIALPLPGPNAPAFSGMSDDQRWVFVQGSLTVATPLWRIDLVGQRVDGLDIAPPAGFRELESCVSSYGAVVDDEGQMLHAFRTDDRAAIFASPDGHTWTQMGEAVTGIQSLRVRAVGGTYVIGASAASGCFTEAAPLTWTSPSIASLGADTTQLVRPNDHASLVRAGSDALTLDRAPLSRSGRYVALSDGTTLRTLDVVTATEVEVTDSAAAGAPVWVAASGL